MTDVLTKEQRRKNMQNIRSKDTKIELQLRKKLWEKGIRYRKNYSQIPGKPDIALTKYKIAIFCDSEFFHGKDWSRQKERLSKSDNGQFWIKKISGNIERDAVVDRNLRALGWSVLRFWGEEINKKPEICVQAIEEAIFQAKLKEFGTVE